MIKKYETATSSKIGVILDGELRKQLMGELKHWSEDHIKNKSMSPVQIIVSVILTTKSSKLLYESTKALSMLSISKPVIEILYEYNSLEQILKILEGADINS